jgi:hypothetical protein
MLKERDRFRPTTLGLALLSGYQEMSLDAMSKPILRANVEADLVRVCQGCVCVRACAFL